MYLSVLSEGVCWKHPGLGQLSLDHQSAAPGSDDGQQWKLHKVKFIPWVFTVCFNRMKVRSNLYFQINLALLVIAVIHFVKH